jgi:hypothetical protein
VLCLRELGGPVAALAGTTEILQQVLGLGLLGTTRLDLVPQSPEARERVQQQQADEDVEVGERGQQDPEESPRDGVEGAEGCQDLRAEHDGNRTDDQDERVLQSLRPLARPEEGEEQTHEDDEDDRAEVQDASDGGDQVVDVLRVPNGLMRHDSRDEHADESPDEAGNAARLDLGTSGVHVSITPILPMDNCADAHKMRFRSSCPWGGREQLVNQPKR